MAKARARTSKTTATANPVPNTSRRLMITQADIAERAYELYVARGCQNGCDMDDWLQAERELTGMSPIAADV